VRTVQVECLDWLFILNRRHLEWVLRVIFDDYNVHRPHRALNLTPPDLEPPILPSRTDRDQTGSSAEIDSAD
jgi:hypothetical protein